MAVTGLALVGFVVMHLLGNLTLYYPDSSLFNLYADKLMSLGAFIQAAEVGLLVIFIAHVILAILIRKRNADARP